MIHACHEHKRQAILLAQRATNAATSALLFQGARPDAIRRLQGAERDHLRQALRLRWQDAPSVYGPYKMLYNRFARWSQMGIFARIFQELAQPGGHGDTLMMDVEPVQRHRFE